MAEIKINVTGQNEASGVLDQVNNSLINLGQSFVARVAEGVLLRDMMHELIDVFKDGVEALPHLVEHTIQAGNQLYEMSLKTGASVENLSALKFVASQTGIEFDGFGTTLFKMEQNLGSSGAKADALQEHLSKLHLNLKTLKDEKPDQAFIDIMSALEQIPNRADQAAAGFAIFGKGFKDMAGLTQDSIVELMQKAHDLGLVMSTDTAASAHAAEIGMKAFDAQVEAVGFKIGESFLPGLVALTQLLSSTFHDAVTRASGTTMNMDGVVVTITQTLLTWADVGISVAQFIDDAFQGTKAMFFDMTGKVVDLANAFVHLLEMGADLAAKTPLVGKEFLGVRDALKDTHVWLGGVSQGLHDEAESALDSAAKHREFFGDLHTGLGMVRDGFPAAFKTAKDEIAEFAKKSHDAYGGVSTDVDELTKKQLDAAAAVRDEIKKIQDQTLSDQQEFQLKGLDLQLAKLDAQQKNEEDAWQKRFDTHKINAEQLGAALEAIGEKYDQQRTNATATEDRKREEKEHTTAETIAKVWDDALAVQEGQGLRGLAAIQANLDRRETAEKDQATKTIKDEVQLVDMLAAIDAKYGAERKAALIKNDEEIATKTQALWSETDTILQKGSLTTTDYQIVQVQRWYDDQKSKAKLAGIDSEDYYKALAADAAAKMDEVRKSHDETYQAIHKLQDDLHGGWEKTFDQTLVKTHDFGKAFRSVFDTIKSDVENVFASMLGSIIQGFLQPLLNQVSSVASSISNAISHALSGGGSGSAAAGAGGTAATGGLMMSGLATAGIGAAIAGGIALVEHFVGPSEETRVVSPERNSWFDQHGGVQGVNEGIMGAFMDQGLSGDEAWAKEQPLLVAMNNAKTNDEWQRAMSNIRSAVPGFAGGVQNFSGGLAMVGERGPELVSLPRGSSVYPNGGSDQLADVLTEIKRLLMSLPNTMGRAMTAAGQLA